MRETGNGSSVVSDKIKFDNRTISTAGANA